MKAVVIGSAGLIGSAISSELGQSHFVIEAGRSSEAKLDMSCAESIRSFPLDGVDVLVYAAGVTDEEVARSGSDAYLRSTEFLSLLLERAVEQGVSRYVYVSSSHVYGRFSGVVDEDSPTDPRTVYALCHYASERIFQLATKRAEVPLLIVRPNAVFGMPRSLDRFQRWSLIPFSFPRELIEHRIITLKSPGFQQRNFISSKDIAKGVSSWLASDNTEMVWNPVGPLTCSVRDFARLCLSVFGDGHLVAPDGVPSSSDEFQFMQRRSIGYQPSESPETFIAEILSRL